MIISSVNTSNKELVKSLLDKASYIKGDNVISELVTIDNSNLPICYGAIEVFAEAVIVLDENRSLREKTEAIKELLHACLEYSKSKNIHDLYAFVKDEAFASVLMKHFGFKTCEGKPLVLNF